MSRAVGNLVLRAAPTRLLPGAALRSSLAGAPRLRAARRAPAPAPRHRALHDDAAAGAAAARRRRQQQLPLPEFSLQDRVVVVTGAARGLGLAQAEALLEAGARVFALDRLAAAPDDAAFARVQARARDELGTRLAFVRVDVRDSAGLNAAVAAVVAETGRLDGLLACAAIQQETPALDYTMEDADRMMGINLTGTFMTAQAVARQMIRLGTPGSMVLVASMSGSVANKGLISPAYNASKAGVIQLGRNLAMEWGSHGIRVNTLSPGYIVTPMTVPIFAKLPEREEQWKKDNMLGRLSYPNEYRGAAVFLLSEASSFMTGSDLRIDGGHTAW